MVIPNTGKKIHIKFTAVSALSFAVEKIVIKSLRFNSKILSLTFFVLTCFWCGFGFGFIFFVRTILTDS